tara:strand:- start:43 stop:333 length:291 start_codon:yes stop_codon:yes gene_type:complete
MSKRCKLQKEYYKEFGNYKGSGKYTDHYVNWLESKVLAINYTHCCTELKDKKEITFKEYLISKGYKLSNNYVWQIDNRDLSNDDVIEQRKQYEYSL